MSLFLSVFFRYPNLQLQMGSSQTQAPGVCGKTGVAGTATLGRLKDMWPEAHQAPNLSSFRSPAATQEGRTLIFITWRQDCDASLGFVEVKSSENFYFGVRGFAVNIGGIGGKSLLTISKCPQNWNSMLANRDKPYIFGSIHTLANNNSLLMVFPPTASSWSPAPHILADY